MKIVIEKINNTNTLNIEGNSSDILAIASYATSLLSKDIAKKEKPIEVSHKEKMVNSKEACKILGITRATLYNRVKDGKLPPSINGVRGRKNSAVWRYSDVMALKASNA